MKGKRKKLCWNRILLLVLVLLFCFSCGVNAFGDTRPAVDWQEVRVSEGDSLWNLVREYNPDYDGNMNKIIYEVKVMNDLEHASLQAGQMLRIPVGL